MAISERKRQEKLARKAAQRKQKQRALHSAAGPSSSGLSLVTRLERGHLQYGTPECVRKLVEGAEAYARELGFEPHPDYHTARLIMGDIDPAGCTSRFTFGHEGKPLYVSGPNDTEARSHQIVTTLNDRLGPDGFHYLVALDGPP